MAPFGTVWAAPVTMSTGTAIFEVMNIASARVDELAQRLARLTGEDVTTAVERAIEERLSRITPASPAQRRVALQEFFDLALRTPVKDPRDIDEIIGYGPDGLPAE